MRKETYSKILYWLSYFFRLIILLEAISAAWQKEILITVASLAILILTFAPSLLRRNNKMNLPIEFEFLFVLFILLSLLLGEINDFFYKYWWWDIFLHSFSGILFSLVGLLIPYILYTAKLIKTTPKFVALFAFAFSLSIGAIWEIFEFIMDQAFGFNMQKSGLVDTMGDLIAETISAFIFSLIAYFYMRRKSKMPIVDHLLEKFVKKNSHLIPKKN